jgi:hypothetical protein
MVWLVARRRQQAGSQRDPSGKIRELHQAARPATGPTCQPRRLSYLNVRQAFLSQRRVGLLAANVFQPAQSCRDPGVVVQAPNGKADCGE